jgi:hypothetical protein
MKTQRIASLFPKVMRIFAIVVILGNMFSWPQASPVYAAGLITGAVFQDFNDNGVRDVGATIPNNGAGAVPVAIDNGVGGIVVTAYDPAGAVAGATASCSAANVPGAWCTGLNNGFYQLNVAGAGPYRVEFTNLPAGFEPGAQGINDFSTVQFVNDPAGGVIANVDVGINRPSDYCQNNPDLATNCYVFGNQLTGPNNAAPVLHAFPYSSGSNGATVPPYDQPPPPRPLGIPANQLGTTWGLAWQRTGGASGYLYNAAYMKKHTGFGPNGPGAIYRIDRATTTAALYVDLNTVFAGNPAGVDPHNNADLDTDNFNTTWNAVGKVAFGGMAMSDDETRLYAMSLGNRTLYEIPLNAPPTGANIRTSPAPLNPPACPAVDDVRPFAVASYRGTVYVGMVCSAESTVTAAAPRGNAAFLRAYVYAVNPVTLAFNPVPVLDFPLNYPRRCFGLANNAACLATYPADWLPWKSTFDIIEDATNFGAYPQPMFTDIVFDADGNMILAFRDRSGDQIGNGSSDNPASPATNYVVLPAGDTLRACGNPAIGWTLEANATCGGVTTGGVGNGQGPGNGEYYFEDNFLFHDDIGIGGLSQIPGFPDVVNAVFDPIPIFPGDGTTTFDAGVRWYQNSTGTNTKGYRVYDGANGTGITFAKANGLGDLVALCQAAPVEIGNRVWFDDDRDGVQDPGAVEVPVPGVTVNLYDPAGNLLATAITDANGNYYFSNAAGVSTPSARYGVAGLTFNTTGFTVRLDNPADYAAGGPLFGWTLTINDAPSGANADLRDSDGVLVGGFPRTTFNVGSAGQNNHTYDFGFFVGPTPTPTATPTLTPTATPLGGPTNTPVPGPPPPGGGGGGGGGSPATTPVSAGAAITPTPLQTGLPREIPPTGVGPGWPEILNLILVLILAIVVVTFVVWRAGRWKRLQ